MDGQQDLGAEFTQSESLIKQQIYEKVRKRMTQFSKGGDSVAPLYSELNPDVIVISDDQTVVFESQNERASVLLHQKCGWDTETVSVRERVRVHPSRSQKLIETLSAAGLKIAC